MAVRLALSDERLNAIVAEVMASMRASEDAAIAEKSDGRRCMCCESPILTPNPSGGTRECDSCARYA